MEVVIRNASPMPVALVLPDQIAEPPEPDTPGVIGQVSGPPFTDVGSELRKNTPTSELGMPPASAVQVDTFGVPFGTRPIVALEMF